MIIKKRPNESAVFYSSNDILVHVQSEVGALYFFEIKISINDVEFDVLKWSKINDNDCILNLRDMFSYIFTSSLILPTIIELVKNENLFKKVDVEIIEKLRSDDSVLATEILPSFYVVPNSENISFNEDNDLQDLSFNNHYGRVDVNSIISIPFFSKSNSITYTITSNGNVVTNNTPTTFGIWELKIPISVLNNPKEFIEVSISDGTTNISKIYTLEDLFRYAPTFLTIKTSIGFYQYFTFFGKKEITPKYQKKTQENYRNQKRIVEVKSSESFKLSPGYLTEEETKCVHQINQLKDGFLIENNVLFPVIILTNSMKLFETDNFSLENTIVLEKTPSDIIDNNSKYTIV